MASAQVRYRLWQKAEKLKDSIERIHGEFYKYNLKDEFDHASFMMAAAKALCRKLDGGWGIANRENPFRERNKKGCKLGVPRGT